MPNDITQRNQIYVLTRVLHEWTEGKYCRGALARDINGAHCSLFSEEAVTWCLGGIIFKILRPGNEHTFKVYSEPIYRTAEHIAEYPRFINITGLNDLYGHIACIDVIKQTLVNFTPYKQ